MNDAYDFLTLELCASLSPALLRLHKNDSARTVVFRLREDGRYYRPAPVTTAILRARKPDGTVLFHSCGIDGETVIWKLTNQTTAVPGILDCELTLYGGDARQLTSARFRALVEDTLYDDSEIESENEFTALSDALSAANNLAISAQKEGKTVTVRVVGRDGTENRVSITDGAGIASITKTSSAGDIDTYTVSFDNGNCGTFTVSNGRSVTGIRLENGDMIVSFSDGTESDAGAVPVLSGHGLLSGRDDENAHPITAITGLTDALAGKQAVLTAGAGITIADGVISCSFPYGDEVEY